MKSSHYNFFFPVDDCTLAYNARTNALAEVEPENLEEIKAILENPENKEKSKHFEDLVHGGFLVEDTFDELVNIRHDMYASRFNTDYLELTIAPTLDCNFRCSYCYEKDVLENKRMTDEVEEKIVELVKAQIPGIKGLHVGWYGGEPLLELKRIKSISQKLIDLCEKNKINYDAGIV